MSKQDGTVCGRNKDTGVELSAKKKHYDWDDDMGDAMYEDAMNLLAECGVPFAPDGTPLGIGWDD